MKKTILIACALGTGTFFAFSYLGLLAIFKLATYYNYSLSAIATFIFLSLLLNTRDIMTRSDVVFRCLRVFWTIAFLCSACCLYVAGCRHIILGDPPSGSLAIDWTAVHQADIVQTIAMYIVVVFLMAAPIGLSYIKHLLMLEDGEDEPAPKKIEPKAHSKASEPAPVKPDKSASEPTEC